MAQNEKVIYVYENWRKESPSLLGKLRSVFVRGQESFSFEYEPQWLKHVTAPTRWTQTLLCIAGGNTRPWTSPCSGFFPIPAPTVGDGC